MDSTDRYKKKYNRAWSVQRIFAYLAAWAHGKIFFTRSFQSGVTEQY